MTVAIVKYWPVAELYGLLATAEGVAEVVVDADKARNHSLADAVNIYIEKYPHNIKNKNKKQLQKLNRK